MTIEEIINDLIGSTEKLTVFCGAGISINSGIPAAIPLLQKILDKLGIDAKDRNKLILPDWKLAMPFEMFFEIFLSNTSEHQILDIFNEGAPSTNHFFICKCFQKKLITEVYTTNFDLLIERAFGHYNQTLNVFRDENSFGEIKKNLTECNLVKVHGSIDNLESIRTTLSTISNRSLSDQRDKVIERIFGSDDHEMKILIFGYSCSDIFDIIPKIEKIFHPKVKVFIVEYDQNIIEKSTVQIEKINLKENENPFKQFSGQRIRVNTDVFIKWIWEKLDNDYVPVVQHKVNWDLHINRWIENFHSEYLKFTVLGQLFYRISDYESALKYHLKALHFNEDNNLRGKGASYANIGLIYHDLKRYEEAIEYHEKAKSIFNEIEFFYGLAAALNNLGYSSIYLDRKSDALLKLKKSLWISRNKKFNENKICESDALCNLGLFYRKYKDYSTSIYYYNLALDIDRQGNKAGEALTLSDMGCVYKLLGDNSKAHNHFLQSNTIAIKMGMQSLLEFTNQEIDLLKK